MNLAYVFLLLPFFQADVPYKPADEFQVNIDVVFKIKNSTYAPSTFSGNGDRLDKASGTTLPFLSVSVTQIKIQSDEVKVVAVNSQGKSIFKKKTSPNLELH